MNKLQKIITLIFLTFLITGCKSADPTQTDLASETADIRFHCAFDDQCPEIVIINDPHQTIDGQPISFRGYGDPTLEFDEASGLLWLSYTWLQPLVADPGPPPKVDLGVRIHLANSADNGRSFTYVTQLTENKKITHPDSGVDGWSQHEISTLALQPDQRWQLLWIRYHDPFGSKGRSDFHYMRTTAPSPPSLATEEHALWMHGTATSDSFNTQHHLRDIPGVEDCSVITEPALFTYEEKIYLASYCIVFEKRRREDKERVLLLEESEDGYKFIGNLLENSIDATHLSVDRLSQADLSVARNGDIILIVTPIISDEEPQHKGCIVYTVNDITKAQLNRDENGHAIARAIITADGNGIGPGLCTYDAASETGIMLVLTKFEKNGNTPDILFSLRATGVHP